MSLISAVQQSDLVLLILFGFISLFLSAVQFFFNIFKLFILCWGLADEGFPVIQTIKNACNAGDPGSAPGLGRPLGEGNGNPFQYSCLQTSMDRELGGLQSMGTQRVGHD